jgi:hypothetical protein
MLDFYSASSLKQQSADRHVILPVHIILITRQPVFATRLNEDYSITDNILNLHGLSLYVLSVNINIILPS